MKSYKERGETQKRSNKEKKNKIERLIIDNISFDKEELKTNVLTKIKDKKPRGIPSVISKDLELMAKIVLRTQYLKKDIFKSIPERIFHILNDLHETPKCKLCFKTPSFRVNRYSDYCGNKCASIASSKQSLETKIKKRKDNHIIFELLKKEKYNNLSLNNDETLSKDLESFFLKKNILINSIFEKETLKQIINKTLFLPEQLSLLERIWYLKNKLTTPIKCKHPNCDNIVACKPFCSKECRLKFNNSGVSKESQSLFETLAVNLNIKKESFYFLNQGEKKIYIKNKKKCYLDFFFDNKVIEYYGDFWHANPNKFKEDNFIINPFSKETVKQVREKDNQRIKEIEKLGYKVLIVWEDDYLKNKLKVLNKCRVFLNPLSEEITEIISFDRVKKNKINIPLKEFKIRKSFKGMNYEEIYGAEKAKQMKECRCGVNNKSSKPRKIIFPNGEEYICYSNFDEYCFSIGINPNCFRTAHHKKKSYKGFKFINL